MRPINVVVAYIVTLSVLIGCDEGIIEPPPPPPKNTPAEVVELIEEALCYRDLDGLAGCLAEDFTFHFDKDDVGKQVGEYTIPDSWASDDFLYVVNSMFGEAYAIDTSLSTSNVEDPGPDDTIFTADKVLIRFIVMVDPVTGYLAKGFVTFEFAAEYNEKDEKEWLVTTWWDLTSTNESGGRNVEEASFGEILALFYKP